MAYTAPPTSTGLGGVCSQCEEHTLCTDSYVYRGGLTGVCDGVCGWPGRVGLGLV